MARVEIVRSLVEEIKKRFSKKEANEILDLIGTLEGHPTKGKTLSTVDGVVVKELKYKGWRFYFITDGYRLKVCTQESLTDLLLHFVRMSDKKHQQQTINEIKRILRGVGQDGFS